MKRTDVACLMFAALAACQRGGEPAGADDVAVLTELATKNVAAQPGSNPRMFNRFTLNDQTFANYDSVQGIVKLDSGTYRIDAYSITTFGYQLTKQQADSARVRSIAGYAFLCDVDRDSLVILGSMQDVMFSLPSILTDVISVTKPTRFQLAHQNGDSVWGVLIESGPPKGNPSINHVMANMVITRLSVHPGTPRKPFGACKPPA